MTDEEGWRRRFTAPTVDGVSWSSTVAGRLAIVSTESGTSQAWAYDVENGERRQASREASERRGAPHARRLRNRVVARPAG